MGLNLQALAAHISDEATSNEVASVAVPGQQAGPGPGPGVPPPRRTTPL